MARETKEVQVHPDKVNKALKWYERFGWEVVSNQRCQEVEWEGDTKYNVTFNKITFTRDKSAPWYKRMVELEAEANDMDEYPYEVLKEKYGYQCKADEVGCPEPMSEPKIAHPQKFNKGLVMLIIGLVMYNFISLIPFVFRDVEFIAQIYRELGVDTFSIIGVAFFILALVGFIKMMKNIKNLKGLKGDKAEKAIRKYNDYITRVNMYNKYVDEFIDNRYKEIFEEAEQLING